MTPGKVAVLSESSSGLRNVRSLEVVDRGARDTDDVFSHLSDRRPRVRGGKEAAAMRTVAGDEVRGADIDGRSLLDEIAREGARRMLAAALEVEVAAYLAGR